MNEVTVCIPSPLRAFTEGADELRVPAETVAEALAAIGDRHGGFLSRVLTPEGRLRPHVNMFVGQESVKALDGLATPLPTGAVVLIVPAVAGG